MPFSLLLSGRAILKNRFTPRIRDDRAVVRLRAAARQAWLVIEFGVQSPDGSTALRRLERGARLETRHGASVEPS
jgi:hypothetical protein